MLKKVILVFKTHFDIGFTDLAEHVIENYAGPMLDEVIATCNATAHMGKQKYVWTMPAWPLKVITQRCDAKKREEVERLIAKGQIVWHALPFTSHTDCCSAEEYIEGLRFAKELSKTYQKPYPISAKMTDVPGHGLLLPELLAGAGVKFLHLGCNAFATPPAVPFLFWWQAKSGKRVLTMYSKGGYGTSLLPPKDWEFPVWMALMHTHDNCGPQSAAAIKGMVERIHKEYPDTEVVCGSMDDFYRELEQYELSRLPVVESDLADTWIHGIGAYPSEVSSLRENREAVRRFQAFYAGALLNGEEPAAEEWLNRYYEEVCLFEEHTWGADVKTWLGAERVYTKERFLEAKKQENYRFMEQSWEEQRNRAVRAAEYAGKLTPLLREAGKKEHFLFNPNGTAYTGWTLLPEAGQAAEGANVLLSGKPAPVMRLGTKEACYVTNLEPFSFAKLETGAAARKKGSLRKREEEAILMLENHRYVLSLHKSEGRIMGLYDKKQRKMLLEAHGKKGVFSYRYRRYGIEKITEYLRTYGYRFSDWGIKDYGRENYPECEDKEYEPEFVAYEVKENELHLFYKAGESACKYGDARQMELVLTLPECGEEIFAELRLKEKQETPFVEAGSFVLPFPESFHEYRLNKSGTVLDPKKDIRENANHVLYALENELSVSDCEGGLCVVPLDTPLAAFGTSGIYEFKREFEEPGESSIYFNLFNNMWGTNFPQWLHGDLVYRYVLFGYEKAEEETLAERAAFLREGLEVTDRAFETAGIRLPEHMQLIGARAAKDGVLLRFLERLGRKAERMLVVPGYEITPVNLFGEAEAPQTAEKIAFMAEPFGVSGFLVQKCTKKGEV